MNPREKVSTQEFTIDTRLSPEAIREAGKRAAEAGTRFLESKVVEHEVTDSSISYVINSSGAFFIRQLMDLTVSWEELGDGRRRVTLDVGEFMMDQMKLYFIPIWPKSVTAMGSLKRFSARLRKELS